MSKIDELINQKAYELDVLIDYRNIINSGSCHNCFNSRDCEYKPQIGQFVRYNCPFYTECTEERIIDKG